jgi:hypothetical protein
MRMTDTKPEEGGLLQKKKATADISKQYIFVGLQDSAYRLLF